MSNGGKQWTDDEIREAFMDDGGKWEYHDPINGWREQRRIAGGIFDAWLADRDARQAGQVAALRAAVRDAKNILEGNGVGSMLSRDVEAHRILTAALGDQ